MIAHLIIDALSVVVAGVAAYSIYPGWDEFGLPSSYATLILVGVLIKMGASSHVAGNPNGRGLYDQLSRILLVWLVTWGLLLAWLVFSKTSSDYSRGWLFLWPTLALVIQGALSVAFKVYKLRAPARASNCTLLLGHPKVTEKLIQQFSHLASVGGTALTSCAVDDREAIKRHAENPNLREVWVCLDNESQVNLKEIIEGPLQASCPNVRVIPYMDDSILVNHGVSVIEGVPMIDIVRSPMHGINIFIKNTEDKLLAMIFIVMLSPFYVVLAILVKLSSPGPVFYAQERVGWNGKTFNMLKFRSMSVDAEASGVRWGSATDKRVTKIGAFMRRTSLDEIPQFFNVLLGHMSIVGPRPERPMFVDQFRQQIPRYMQKHLVKAGITGWAQINGWRGDTDLHQRISHDLFYIDNWSVWFDLKIVLLTPFKGLVHKNAK